MIFMAELNGFLPVVEIASDEGKKNIKKVCKIHASISV